MKKNLPILIAVISIVAFVVVYLSRPHSDSKATYVEEPLPQSPTTAISDNGYTTEDHSSQPSLPVTEDTATPSLENRQSAIRAQLDAIQKESDYKERPSMLFDLMYEASMVEVTELLAISEENATYSLGLRDSMKAAAYERWYHLDPAAALMAMDASSLSASQKNSRMETLLEDWASQSPDAVTAFLEEGQVARVSSDLTYAALVRGSASNGALGTVDAALDRIEDPKLKYYALKSAARVLQRNHSDQFDAWLSTLPDVDKNTALAESAWILADKEIDRALVRLNRLEGRRADELPVTRQRVVVKWANNEPAKAARWVADQKVTGKDREVLFANLLSVWTAKDQSAAVAWVDALIVKGEIDEAFMNRVVGKF